MNQNIKAYEKLGIIRAMFISYDIIKYIIFLGFCDKLSKVLSVMHKRSDCWRVKEFQF